MNALALGLAVLARVAVAPATAPATAPAAQPPVTPPVGALAERRAAVEKSVGEVLSGEGYLFCHDPDYPLYADEAGWCKLASDPNARCPSLPRACKGGTNGDRPGRASGDGRGKLGDREEEPRFWKLPDLGGLGQILFYLLIAGAVGGIAWVIVRSLVHADDDPEPRDPETDGDSPAAAAAAASVRGPIETDVERLLARARTCAENGELERALDWLYAALLRRLDGDGLIRIRPWRTNGDYLRELRARPDLHPELAAIVREIERVQFGAAPASDELYSALYRRVLPIVSRTLAALALALTVFGAASCSWHKRGAYDDSPSGTHAVLELLDKTGFHARRRLEPLARIKNDDDATLLLLPGARVDAAAWDHLLAWVKRGHTLVVATGSKHLPVALGVELAASELAVDAAVPEDARVPVALRGELGDLLVRAPEHRSLRFLHGDDAAPLLVRKHSPYASETELGEGAVIVLADEHLLTNASLATADNAAFLVALLDRYNTRLEFSDEATGVSAANPLVSIGRGKLAPLTLQLALLLGLFFVYRGAAFGALRDPPRSSRRSFVEHVRALGATYGKARASRHALELYSVYALDRLRESARLSGSGSLSRLAEAVARRTGRPLGQVMRLVVEARTAREQPAAKSTVVEDLELLRELGQLIKDLGGPREHQ